MATAPRPQLSTRDWGDVILMALMLVLMALIVAAAAVVYDRLKWAPFVYVAWALLVMLQGMPTGAFGTFGAFDILFVVACVIVVAWYLFAKPWVPREGRASGVYATIVFLVFLMLVVTLGFILYFPS